MHQPNYREPHSRRLAMPWVRLHALKDYLDMPLRAAEYENVRVTFNLVPSLLDQLDLYLEGGTDRHLELTRLRVEELDDEQRLEILDTFFTANPAHMIEPYDRYRELYKKYRSGISDRRSLPRLFSSGEYRDLQVWSNLTWIDPMFREEEPVRSLFAEQRHFTEEEKMGLLGWERDLIGRIVPGYRKLQDDGKIEVSFTPYNHPILPLLCDTDVAREALPSIKLPRQRFCHPEDAEYQIAAAVEKYERVFGRKMAGMWPSEGSVSEEVLRMMIRHGVKWTATDQEILVHSLRKSGMNTADNPVHRVYEFGPGLKLLFRDHALSDRIGFVYSTWDPHRAVADFVGHIKQLRGIYANRLDSTVVPIILDGENAWEYFPNDATEFLSCFYETLNADKDIQTVTMSEAAQSPDVGSLPSVFAGSWINHNFRIWIGHHEDNTAWDLLQKTRDTLTSFQAGNPNFDPLRLKQAWDQIYIAEGSDWCWWYGDEHRGEDNDQFDRIYRQHLVAVYELLGLEIPLELLKAISEAGVESCTVMPDGRLTPKIDGRVTQYYEWAGSGFFDCVKAGGTMHQVDRQITGIHFAYDGGWFYIRLDFRDKKEVESIAGLKLVVTFFVPERVTIGLNLNADEPQGGTLGEYKYAIGEIFEMSVARDYLWPDGHGPLSFVVTLLQDGQKLENWPEYEPVHLEVPRRDEEIFWPF